MSEIKRDPFGCLIPANVTKPLEKDGHLFVHKLSLTADPEAPSRSKVLVENVNLQQLIDSFRDQCGIEYIMKQMAAGLVDPNSICDDGTHGVDLTGAPEWIGETKKFVDDATKPASDLLASLGLSETELRGMSEDNLAAAIAAKLKPFYDKKEEAPKEGE